MRGAWAATLNGISLVGGDASHLTSSALGFLELPPDGMGLPDLRTEDVVYLQRDGVQQFSDWYTNRIVTLAVSVKGGGLGCPDCSAREAVQQILKAWSRQCDTVELVIWTDCSRPPYCPDSEDPVPDWWVDQEEYDAYRAVHGPFIIRGRPRVARTTWLPGEKPIAQLTLRFDAEDHLMYVAGCDGTPQSTANCVVLTPLVETACRVYDRCYDQGAGEDSWCYDNESGDPGEGPQEAVVYGTECVCMDITMVGPLTAPTIENLTTGEIVTYQGLLAAGQVLLISTCDGTATLDGENRTSLLRGDTRMTLSPGINELRLTSTGGDDSGQAEVCYPWAVVSA